MRRIKILFLFIVLFLLSGCTANYRLSISESGEIEEDIKFLESTSVLKTFSNSIQSDLDKELQNVKQSGIYDSYTMDAFVEDGYGIGTGKRVYSSFDNFKNNSIIVNEMFEDISIIDNGKVVSIHLKPVSNFKYFEESSMYSSLLDKVNFEINIPYKVIDGNYDKEENGVYTWTINKGENLKGINISYSTNENIFDKIPLSIWIISSIIFVILLISVYVYIKYKLNSK